MNKLEEIIKNKLVQLGLITLAEGDPVEGEEVVEEVVATEAAPAVVIAQIKPTPIDITYSAIGAPVMQKDAEGVETVVMDGEYLVQKDEVEKKIVIVDGKLESETVVETVEDVVELSETVVEPVVELTEEPATEPVVEEPVVEEPLSEADLAMAAKLRSVMQNIDITKPGQYYISLDVNEDLDVTWASMSSSTYETLMTEQVDTIGKAFETKLAEEISKYENIIEALKSGETKIKDKPEIIEMVKLSRAQILKAQLMDKSKITV